MGYDIHITRKDNWADEDGLTITLDEWCDLIATDPTLRSMPILNADSDVLMDDPDAGSTAFQLPNGDWWPIWWFEGDVFTKNPPPSFFAKLAEIADALNAHLQGDDGELYDGLGDPLPNTTPQNTARQIGWLSRLFGRGQN